MSKKKSRLNPVHIYYKIIINGKNNFPTSNSTSENMPKKQIKTVIYIFKINKKV